MNVLALGVALRLLLFGGNGAKKPNGAHPDVVEEEIGRQVSAGTR